MKTIYAIPGLGTDDRLFQFIKIEGVRIIVLKWPEPAQKWSLQQYAEEFVTQIDSSKPFYLMGVSFGGMLCTELSKIVSPEKTILISSCKSRKELPGFLRLLKYVPLYKIIPEQLHRKMAWRARWFLGFEKSYLPEFISMVKAMPNNYFRYCIHYIVNWDAGEAPARITHIHGNADRLLLYNDVKADHTIEHGSHAMVINQAGEINKILEKELN